MSHATEQIRDQIVTTLTGLTTTGTTVYSSRVYTHDTLPSLVVDIGPDAEVPDMGVMGGTKQMRRAGVIVEGRAKSVSGMRDTLDTIKEEVETALYTDRTLNGLCKDIEDFSAETEISGETDQPIGLVTMTFTALYRIDAAAPDVIIA